MLQSRKHYITSIVRPKYIYIYIYACVRALHFCIEVTTVDEKDKGTITVPTSVMNMSSDIIKITESAAIMRSISRVNNTSRPRLQRTLMPRIFVADIFSGNVDCLNLTRAKRETKRDRMPSMDPYYGYAVSSPVTSRVSKANTGTRTNVKSMKRVLKSKMHYVTQTSVQLA